MKKAPFWGSATPIEDITTTKQSTLTRNQQFRKEASKDAQ